MTIFYSSVSNVKKWSAALAFLLLMGVQLSWAQTTALTPYPLREGTYQEAFTAIATWGSNFSTGTGANRFGVAYPDPVYPNTNTVFSTGSTGGVQKGTAAIVLLSTGSDGEKPAAFDLHLDFSGTAAGTISLDWAEVNNSTGNRQSTFKLQTNTGPNGLFIDLPQTATVLTNNQAASGKLTVALPAAFNNNAQAKVRFYMSASAGGIAPSGSRPKISIDNLQVTAATSESPAITTITTGAVATTSFCVTTTAGSPEFAVPYTGSGSFTGTYKVQLSDAAGVFTATTTTNIIGTGSSSPITAVIPAGTASGSKYRVRVLNDAPATYGTDNGTDLTVSLAAATNTVTVSPTLAQTVPTTGTGATLQASTAATSTFTWKYATSPTGPYAAIAGATTNSYQLQGSDFPTAGTYYVVAEATTTSACASATGVSEPITVTVSAPISVPALTVSATSLPSFGNIALGEGAPLKSFTVGGTNLSDNITITPPTGFEICTGNTPFACCAIVLQPVNGEVPTTVIDVRFTPTAVQASEATIPVTSTGLPAAAVAVSGTGVEPMYPASLSTTTLSGLTPTTATTGGTVDTDGGSAVTARGVVWSRTANPLLGTTKTSDGTGTGTFASTITGLLPGTTYYVRAYATNATSTAYGEELSFTTVEVPLAVQPTSPASLTATQVTGTSLQLNLTGGDGAKRLVVARLGSAVDAEPVNATTYLADAAFGKGSVLGKGNYVVYNGTGDTLTVTNLRPNTPYYFTVFAFNDNNTPYAENYLTTTPGTLTQTTTPVPTALLLEENFDYAAGSLLTATNWTAHSGAGTKPVAVTATGLSYPGYGPNSGNAAAVVASGEDVNRTFEAVYARTPVYVSYLVNVANASTSLAGDYFFHLGPKAIGTTFRSRIYVRKDATTNKVQFGITSGTGTTTFTTEQYELNATHLVVLKYSFTETGSTAQLFINPTTDTEPATATASATETGATPAAPNDNIGSVALRQGASSPNLVVDGIRVGTTYKAVKTGITCEPPVLAVPTVPVATAAADQCGAPVLFAATVSGDPEPSITYSIVKEGVATTITSPYIFPVGATTVTATATNRCGTDTQTFVVTVQDKQAPLVLTQNVTVALSNGTATVTAAQVNNGSTDACGIATLALSQTTFSCENIGANTVTLTATDRYGNTASQTAIINVTGTVPTPAIAVKPSSTVYTGGVPTNLYLGYGPQSVTLAASGGVSYHWSPATGLSNATSANPVFTATAAGTFTYTVTVTSNSGCTATKSVVLQVIDVRCGNKNKGIMVCHKGSSQCEPLGDIAGHLAHGDQLGTCAGSLQAKSSSDAQLLGDATSTATAALLFEAYPNPFTERTVVHFRPVSTGTAQLQIYNSLGQVVKTFHNGVVQGGQDYEFTLEGSALPAGLYTGRLLIDGKVQTIRVVLNK